MKIYNALMTTATSLSFALLSVASAIADDGQSGCQGQCPPVQVPEPSTLAVLGAAVIGLAALRRSMKK